MQEIESDFLTVFYWSMLKMYLLHIYIIIQKLEN